MASPRSDAYEAPGPTASFRTSARGVHPWLERGMDATLAFDEDWYLSTYPDVAAAVEVGHFRNALQHFELYGREEGRLACAGPSPAQKPVPEPEAAAALRRYHTSELNA